MHHLFSKFKKSSRLLVLPVLLSACSTPSQIIWDAKVRGMCEKDGGVTVFEQVELSKAKYPMLKFALNGDVILPSERRVSNNDPFYWKGKTDIIKDGYLSVVRHESSIVRSKDQKILSTSVSFARGGGDVPTGISHPSSFSCRDIDGFELNTSNLTFIYLDTQQTN
jgi:hypothetical protein